MSRESEKGPSKAKGKQGQGKRRRESGRSLANKWERAREESNEESSEEGTEHGQARGQARGHGVGQEKRQRGMAER